MFMKIVDALLAILFIAFAAFQFNDPDPYLWALLYALVGLVAGLALFGISNRLLTLGALVACAIGLIWVAPGFFEYITDHTSENILQDMSAERPYIEETREFGGLTLALLTLAFYLWRSRRPASP